MKSPPPAVKRMPPVAELEMFANDHPTHRLSRRAIAVDGITYRLLLAVPKADAPAVGFPILYLLDGNALFDHLSPSQLASADGMILAGINHDTPFHFDPPSRSRDFTPDARGEGIRADPARPDRLIGGADIFLRRLTGPIREDAETGLPVDGARRMIFGHSLAGMFALYALLRAPEAFARVAAASPSIWWGDELMLKLEADAPHFAASRDVLVTLGDSERRSSPSGPHWDGPAPHTLDMIARLEARRNMRVSSHVLAGLEHAATLPASLPLVLDFAARDRT